MKATWATGIALALLVGCGTDERDVVIFEGQPFVGDIRTTRDDRAAFTVTGGPASVSLEGARQAASYQAVQRCIQYLGSSDVAWTNGPDVDDSALVIVDNEVVLTGRCIEP